jgi:hypothetical protein
MKENNKNSRYGLKKRLMKILKEGCGIGVSVLYSRTFLQVTTRKKKKAVDTA